MTAILSAPTYVLARAAWIQTLVIWHADGGFTRLEGDPCEDYATARAASWRLRPTPRDSRAGLMHSDTARRGRLLYGA